MNMDSIKRQLAELDFPRLCRFAFSTEEHPRCVVLCNDGNEWAVSIHPTDGTRPQIYYHGSQRDCHTAYEELLTLFSVPSATLA